MPSIKLMNDTTSFSPASVNSENVGDLRKELELSPSATVNINGVIAKDSDAISDDDFVGAVSSNKTGGIRDAR